MLRKLDPATAIPIGLAILLTTVFFVGFQHGDIVAKALPAMAIAFSISLLLVPQKNISNVLMILAGLSVPFAHFAIVVVAGEGIQ